MSDAVAGTPQVPPVARLGLGGLQQPLSELTAGTLTSFRAVPDSKALGQELGPLKNLPGRWMGTGFNLIARPDFSGQNDIFLELNLTREILEFSSIGSPIPNRGSQQDDINLFGVHYTQLVSDATTGGALHIEPGIWLSIPATTVPNAPASVARLATIPHGDAVNAQGQALSVNGGPKIQPANTVPFPIGGPTPPPGTPNGFPEYTLTNATPFRTAPLPPAITQAIVTNPNSLLIDQLVGQTVTKTEVLIVATDSSAGFMAAGGGVENIPFVVQNADAAFVSAIFWIETVKDPIGGSFLQLQYTQTVLLNFLGLSWPHVSVATLVKTF